MKSIFPAFFLAAVLGSGCAFHERGLVLDPVGPAAFTSEPDPSNGSLVVYSALDQAPHFNGVSYHIYYSDYKVLSDEGALLRKIHNDSDSVTEGPVRVKLQPGRYRVFARANGYGWITVPVVIATHQTTTVHLEGGDSWPH